MFLASSVWLFLISNKYQSGYGADWWAVYFENPKDASLNFVIENHSNQNNFHWDIISGTDKIKSGDISVVKGSTWTSNVQIEGSNKKITVVITAGDEKKEIYKNL